MLIKILSYLLSCLPRKALLALGRLVGCIAWYGLSKRRAITIKNTRMAFGKDDSARIAYQSFQHFSTCFLEFIMAPYWHQSRHKRWLRFIDFPDILSQQPSILISGHIGQWELFPVLALEHGISLVSIYQRVKHERVNQVCLELRRMLGSDCLLEKDEFTRGIQGYLDQHNSLVLLSDQGRGSPRQFMGQPTCFPRSMAHLAYRSKRVVVFAASSRNGSYIDFTFSKPISIRDNESKPAFQERLLTTYVQWLEGCVKRYPEQYFWLHDLWKKNHSA